VFGLVGQDANAPAYPIKKHQQNAVPMR